MTVSNLTLSREDTKGRTDVYYLLLWQTLTLTPPKYLLAKQAVDLIVEGKHRYEYIESRTGVDWRIVGTIHYMEASCNFDRQLFNGEKWNKKTTLIPKNLGPWRSWEDSAVDLFEKEEYPEFADVGATLRKIEMHNGKGYIYKGIHSPYLWSFSNHYKKGKYVADGKYNPNAVSRQVGAAVLLKMLDYASPIQLELDL